MRYFNTTDSSVTIDNQGRSLDGHAVFETDQPSPQIRHQLDLGNVILLDDYDIPEPSAKMEPSNSKTATNSGKN